jgi:hypothetical protein
MLMKIGNRDGQQPDGIGIWSTGLSWFDEGTIHPITAQVVYATPEFEIVDVTLDYDKKTVEIPDRLTAMIVATAVDEYAQVVPALKKKRAAKKTTETDPMFE